jgi:N-methylhydantoinase B/oxoprolinase/acetone carboxylase alpha subunit
VDDILNAREINIGGKATVRMGKGDRLRIETPGGGGWGPPGEEGGIQSDGLKYDKRWAARGSVAEREVKQAGF